MQVEQPFHPVTPNIAPFFSLQFLQNKTTHEINFIHLFTIISHKNRHVRWNQIIIANKSISKKGKRNKIKLLER